MPENVKNTVLAELRQTGTRFVEIADFCGLIADRNPQLQNILAETNAVTVIACYPRTIKWLLDSAGWMHHDLQLQVFNLRTSSADEIIAQLHSHLFGQADAKPITTAETNSPWEPWFPIIDYDRCRQCRQCLNFCLFGVYEVNADNRVIVANPRNCKNNCPACARICPDAAIIFPKLPEDESPLNGSDIGDECEWKARTRVQTRELLGDDVHAALIQRQQMARRRRLKRQAEEQATAERSNCLADAQGGT
jgi:NAD-dependent dihydropyrimidine dehydrogenase PreA subunit